MEAAHAAGALVALGAAGVLSLVAAGAALLDRGHRWVRRLAAAAVVLFAAQGLAGVPILLTGSRAADGLHLLYGGALVLAVPMALTFASEAPDRARSGVLAAAGVAAMLLVWRLYSTA